MGKRVKVDVVVRTPEPAARLPQWWSTPDILTFDQPISRVAALITARRLKGGLVKISITGDIDAALWPFSPDYRAKVRDLSAIREARRG